MHLLPWLYMSVNLGLLPGLAMVPIQKPVADTKTYESHLFMQMWGNFEDESEAGKEEENGKDMVREGVQVLDEVQSEVQVEAINEQTAVYETVERVVPVTEGTAVNDTEDTIDTASTTYTEEDATAVEVVEPTPEPVVESTFQAQTTPLYQVDGYIPDVGLQEYLYNRLAEHGIEWFFPYCICLIAQESSWNPVAQNANGRDKGLLQYRIEYVPWMDWTNPYQQIDYFVQQMANRANIGCTVSDMISRHKQSDYGFYDQEYVNQVMSHSGSLTKVR